jgi:hypothetical protein
MIPGLKPGQPGEEMRRNGSQSVRIPPTGYDALAERTLLGDRINKIDRIYRVRSANFNLILSFLSC